MTVLTDCLLSGVCLVLADRLRRRGLTGALGAWAAAFAACGAAALLGGTYHGLLPRLPGPWASALWDATMLSVGVAALAGTLGTARSRLPRRFRRLAFVLAGLQLVVYAAFVLRTDTFLAAIIDYSLAFGFVLAVYGRSAARNGDAGARWVVAGVLVSFLAGAVQAAGWAPHAQFNHNDLYHLIQIGAMWLLYKGVSSESSAS